MYISLQPSFNAQAGILDEPGAFRQFKLCFFLHSADVMNRNENLLFLLLIVVVVVVVAVVVVVVVVVVV